MIQEKVIKITQNLSYSGEDFFLVVKFALLGIYSEKEKCNKITQNGIYSEKEKVIKITQNEIYSGEVFYEKESTLEAHSPTTLGFV